MHGNFTHVYVDVLEQVTLDLDLSDLTKAMDLKIGACDVPGNGMQPFSGRIDEVSLWSTVLDAQTLSTSHDQLTGMEPNLLGYWQFEAVQATLQVANLAIEMNTRLNMEILLERFDLGITHASLFLGPSGSSQFDFVETPSSQAARIKLNAWPAGSCKALTFTILELPDFGLLFQVMPLDNSSTTSKKGDAIKTTDELAIGWVYFEVTDHFNQDKITSFVYSATCDGVESITSARVIIHVSSLQVYPHLDLQSRVEYSVSAMNVYDPDEGEYNSASSFTLKIDGGFSPTLKFPSSGLSASITSSENSSLPGSSLLLMYGSGKAAEIDSIASGVRVEVKQDNPMTAQIQLSIDDSGDALIQRTSTLGLQHLLGSVPVIHEIFPQEIPLDGSVVEVFGKNLAESFVCVVGNILAVQAVYVAPTHLQCTIPKQNQLGLLELLVYPAGFSGDASNLVNVKVVASIQIVAVQPSTRIVHPGSEVIISVSPDFSSQNSRCRIDDTHDVVPHRVTLDSIACRIPFVGFDGASGNIAISITENQVKYYSVGQFQLVKRPSVNRLSPLSGFFLTKLQEVKVFGSSFVNGSELVCSVGNIQVRGVFVSASQVRCPIPAPADAAEMSLPIEISVNGIDFSNSGKAFKQFMASTITKILPTNGPIRGGTLISISGDHFSSSVLYTCTFGSIHEAPAKFVSQTVIQCASPAVIATGLVEIEVLANTMLLPRMAMSFTYSRLPTVERVVPELGQIGIETLLAISGNDFEDSGSLTCLFEQASQQWKTKAVRIDSTLIQCASPSQLRGGFYNVRVSVNDQDYSTTSARAQLFIHEELILQTAAPSSGPTTGGSEVAIQGDSFVPSDYLACRFGSQPARAVFESSTRIVCVSPAWDETSTDRVVSVRVALNGIQFSKQAVRFQYYSVPVITSVIPAELPTNTSVSLNVSGYQLSRLGETWCQVGEARVKAEYLEPDVIKCGLIWTPSEPGVLSLSISLNGQDFSPVRKTIFVHAPLRLASVEPSVMVQDSNSVIKVSGTDFVATDAVLCSLGSSQVNGSVVSRELVLCDLPLNQPPGRFEVEISLNRVHFSSSSGLFIDIFELPTFSASLPSSGLSHGGENITVSGTGFELPAGLPLFCVFGDNRLVRAQVANSTSLSCTTPDFGVGFGERTAAISFMVGKDLVTSPLTFRFSSPPVSLRALQNTTVKAQVQASSQLAEVSPATNTTLQAPRQLFINGVAPKFVIVNVQANITVSGEGFPDEDIFCYYNFEIRPILGRVLSNSTLECLFPGFSTPRSIQLALSLSRGPPLSNALEIVVVEAMEIDSVSPSSGSPTGGTLISIAGRNLPAYEQLYCLFDDISILSVQMDRGLVSCVTPPSRKRVTQVRLSSQERELVSNAVVYTYEIEATLSFLTPELGQVEGGTAVTLRGNDFKEDEGMICFFGSVQVSIERVNSTAMRVIAPPSPNGMGAVIVHCMESDAPMASPRIEFTYIPGLRISQIAPQLGYSSASTRVSVRGSGFLPDHSMSCRFGEVFVAAQFISSEEVECTAPPSAPGAAEFSVVLDPQNVPAGSTKHVFEYIGNVKPIDPVTLAIA